MALKIPEIVTQAERESFMDRNDLTLDGKPAWIKRAPDGFAYVDRQDSCGGRVEFSWFAVRVVCEERGGAFRS